MKNPPYVETRKLFDSIVGWHWQAFWRGTENRLQYRSKDGQIWNVPPRIKRSDLIFDLRNNYQYF